jgi:uncharacterized membrane protein
MKKLLWTLSAATLVCLIFLTLAWELWLAPLRPGGSWLVLKTLPLLLPLRGVLAGRVYTYRWAMMLVLAYFMEGVVRAYGDRGTVAMLATVEVVLALIFFVSSIAYVRATRAARPVSAGKARG